MPKKAKTPGPKAVDLEDELRIISMEYADIRSRMEATDLQIDQLMRQLAAERRQLKLSLVLLLAVLILAAVTLLSIFTGF